MLHCLPFCGWAPSSPIMTSNHEYHRQRPASWHIDRFCVSSTCMIQSAARVVPLHDTSRHTHGRTRAKCSSISTCKGSFFLVPFTYLGVVSSCILRSIVSKSTILVLRGVFVLVPSLYGLMSDCQGCSALDILQWIQDDGSWRTRRICTRNLCTNDLSNWHPLIQTESQICIM